MIPYRTYTGRNIHVCIHACIHVCIYARVNVGTGTITGRYTHTCIHAYMHTCIHAYMRTCIHAYMHTCITPRAVMTDRHSLACKLRAHTHTHAHKRACARAISALFLARAFAHTETVTDAGTHAQCLFAVHLYSPRDCSDVRPFPQRQIEHCHDEY